ALGAAIGGCDRYGDRTLLLVAPKAVHQSPRAAKDSATSLLGALTLMTGQQRQLVIAATWQGLYRAHEGPGDSVKRLDAHLDRCPGRRLGWLRWRASCGVALLLHPLRP